MKIIVAWVLTDCPIMCYSIVAQEVMNLQSWNNNGLIRQFEQFKELAPHNTQAEFARRCGVPRSVMCRWLNNETLIGTRNAMKLCKALKCKPHDLFERVEVEE